MDDKADWVRRTVDDWEGRLVAYARRFLAGDVERARDVVQDTFLRLWQADRADVDGHLARWLYTVCRHRAIDVRRKDGRMVTSTDGAMAAADARAMDGPSAADRAAAAEAAATGGGLLAAVATLPPRQQEAVRLRFQGGLSYADIAGVMETSTSNVGVLLHTAMKSLRERLAETDDCDTNTGAPGTTGTAGGPLETGGAA